MLILIESLLMLTLSSNNIPPLNHVLTIIVCYKSSNLIILHLARMMPPHQLLIVISGTIPVSYTQQIFNIPVELWIPHMYPRTPPMAYVTPTTGMMLKSGASVSSEGMFYSPLFMSYWQSNPNVLLINNCSC